METPNLEALKDCKTADERAKRVYGFNYAIQFETVKGDFGEEIYFKSADEVGPFLRETFRDDEKAKIKNTRTI